MEPKVISPTPSEGGKLAILLHNTHLCTDVAWREKNYKHFVFYKYFCLVLGLLKSRILEKNNRATFEQTRF